MPRSSRSAPRDALSRSAGADDGLDRLPNLMVIGAPKCATSTLAAGLGQHPDVYFPHAKETHFFSWDDEYRRGLPYLAHTHYDHAGGHAVRGDATPAYLASRTALDRIATDLPEASHRFVVVLRDPVARMWSQYRFARLLGQERRSFTDALDDQPAMEDDPMGSGLLCYSWHGAYGTHLKAWFDVFPRESLLVLRYDDLLERPADSYGEVFRFCAVADGVQVAPPHANPGGSSRFGLRGAATRIPEPTRRALRRVVPFGVRQRAFELLDAVDRRPSSEHLDPVMAARLREEAADEVSLAAELTGLDLTSWLPGSDAVSRTRR